MIRRSIWKQAACALVLSAMSLLTSPLGALAGEAVSTELNTAGIYTLGWDCLGEPIFYMSTVHLVTVDGQIVHGNTVDATAIGVFSGEPYLFIGSPANLTPAGDGDFLYHLTFIGKGANSAKLSITAKGQLNQPEVEIIQSHCTNARE